MVVLQGQSHENDTLSQSSSEPTQSVHKANKKHTKEDALEPEHTSADLWIDSKVFPWSTEKTPDHPEDSSGLLPKDRTRALAAADVEDTLEERTVKGHTSGDVREHGTVVTRALIHRAEDDWKDTHMQSEESEQNTSRYVALQV